MRRLALFWLGALLAAGCTDAVAPIARPLVPSFSNGSSDATPPTLTALSLTPDAINTTTSAADVTVGFTVTDDLAGGTQFCVYFRSPSGSAVQIQCASFSAATSHTGSVVVSFPQFSEAGTWQVDRIELRDAANNFGSLATADLAARGFPTMLTVTSVSDVAGPGLAALTFTPGTINTTESAADVTVDFTVTDNLSGATGFCVLFRNPSQSAVLSQCASFPAAARHSGAVVVSFPRFSEAGDWSVLRIELRDAVRNFAVLSASDLDAVGFPSKATVVSASDATAPALTALSLSPTTINTSNGAADVTVGFTVTDNLAGATQFCVLFRNPSESAVLSQCASFGAATSHTGSLVVTFPQFSEAGTWRILRIELRDAVNNFGALSGSTLDALGFPTSVVVQNTVHVTIDVLPGLSTNIVFPRLRLPIPVAIANKDGFDPATVVVSSLRFGATGTEVGPLHWKLVDYDGDGDRDLVLLFPMVGSGIVCGATVAKLTGQTLGGDSIEGTDAIKTLGCR